MIGFSVLGALVLAFTLWLLIPRITMVILLVNVLTRIFPWFLSSDPAISPHPAVCNLAMWGIIMGGAIGLILDGKVIKEYLNNL